jgi:hypothetical protein
MLNREQLYPYLFPGLLNPEWATLCPEVGHGLVIQLFQDNESEHGIVHATIGPDELRGANLTPEEAHRIALDNLVRFADDSPDLSIQVLGAPGDPVHFLLHSDHPRASACLLLPDLYEQAADVLKESDLLACVPQRESLVVFPKRDRAYREMLVGKLREIEADARRPLTFELFALSKSGVVPFSE